MPTLEEIRSVEYPPIVDLGELDSENEGDGEEAGSAEGETPADPEAGAAGEVDASDKPVDGVDGDDGVDAGSVPVADKPGDAGPDKAKLFDDLNERFTSDRAGFVKQLLGGLSDAERAAVLGIAPPAPDSGGANAKPAWEPQSEAEEHYAKHFRTLEEVPAFAQRVHQEFETRDRYLNEALITTHATDAKLDAVLQFLELTLPAADVAALNKALSDGKTGYKDAVKSHYRPALEKAIADKKQAAKPRPRTPGNGSGDTPRIKKGASMVEIFNQQ